MIKLTKDIDSLTNFKRQTTDFVARMKETGEPIVLTINGKAELVVQDADSYQRLIALAERVESLEFLRRSLAAADTGQTRPFRKAVQALGRKR